MSVIVTGGTGLLGAELIIQLVHNGAKVRGLYLNNPPSFFHPLLEWIQCDMLDVEGLELAFTGMETLYHCAGLVSFKPGDAARLYQVNVEGTANVVNAALDAQLRKMVHVSSVATLGPALGKPVSEDVPWAEQKSLSKYGQSKYLGELEVWRGMAEGLNVVIVNPSIILGNGNWENGSTSLFKSVYDGLKWYTDGAKGFVDVKDVARAMILLMQQNEVNGRFVINGHNTSFQHLFHLIATCFKKKTPSKKATPFLAGILWRYQWLRALLGGRPALITPETVVTAFSKVQYDSGKLLQALPGFYYTPLEETVTGICHALQQKLNNH